MSSGFALAVPGRLSDKDLQRFFRGWDWKDDPPSPVTLDFSQVTFIAPWAATLFATYGVWLREVRNKDVRAWIDDRTEAGQYLIRAGVAGLLNADSAPPPSTSTDRISQLARVRSSDEITVAANSLMQVLSVDDQEMQGALRYTFIELLRNVVQHARSRVGGFCHATYLPKTGMVDLVVADAGCGIRTSLNERYPELKSDYKAVKFATQPHVSSTFSRGAYGTMANNAGLGLFFIKEIVSRGCGGFFLGSGQGMADYWGNADGSAGKNYIESRCGGWRGTFALVQLRRNMIADFDSLLQTCREISAKVRKDPSELKLDFVDGLPEMEGLLTIRVQDFEENVERAAQVRDQVIIPNLQSGKIVILDFAGIQVATQSFVHALIYRVLRDVVDVEAGMSIANASPATREALRAVAAYAAVDDSDLLA